MALPLAARPPFFASRVPYVQLVYSTDTDVRSSVRHGVHAPRMFRVFPHGTDRDRRERRARRARRRGLAISGGFPVGRTAAALRYRLRQFCLSHSSSMKSPALSHGLSCSYERRSSHEDTPRGGKRNTDKNSGVQARKPLTRCSFRLIRSSGCARSDSRRYGKFRVSPEVSLSGFNCEPYFFPFVCQIKFGISADDGGLEKGESHRERSRSPSIRRTVDGRQ